MFLEKIRQLFYMDTNLFKQSGLEISAHPLAKANAEKGQASTNHGALARFGKCNNFQIYYIIQSGRSFLVSPLTKSTLSILANSRFVTDTKMASAWWSLRGDLHEFEILLEGIRFQFSDNYILVTLETERLSFLPRRHGFCPFFETNENGYKIFLFSRSLRFPFFSLSHFFFFARPTDLLSRERGRWETKHFTGMAFATLK